MSVSMSCSSTCLETLTSETGFPSQFAKALNFVAASLTSTDLSSMKLLLISDGIFKKNVLDKCSNAADLLTQLYHSGYLSRKRMNFLLSMLTEIHRKDLARELQKLNHLTIEDNNFPTRIRNLKRKHPMEQEEESLMNYKTSDTSIEISEEVDDFEIGSSQESISDEEKLQKQKFQNSEELFN